MKRTAAWILAFAVAVAPPAAAADERREATVRWVIDGDTFQTAEGERVRLLGMDAPEYQPHRRRIDPFGKQASDYAKKRLTGKKVFLEGDVEPEDKYGRTLAYVYLEDGTLFNRELVAEGLARSKYYKPNGRYYPQIKAAQKEAKKAKKGLWSAETPKKKRRSS